MAYAKDEIDAEFGGGFERIRKRSTSAFGQREHQVRRFSGYEQDLEIRPPAIVRGEPGLS